MNFLKELKEFTKNISYWLFSLLVFCLFFFAFGLEQIDIFGKNLFLPLPTLNSFSSRLFLELQKNLLPEGVKLIATNPLSAFTGQLTVAFLMAFIFAFPVLLYKIIRYLSPALRNKEKRVIYKILVPSGFLFISGCLFAYFFIIPPTFKILYSYAVNLGALPFFSVNEFVGLTFGFSVAVGIMFLLPVFMLSLSFLGIIEQDFWKKKWRYAISFFLIISAIITPDGTGITMAMLSLPLSLLYLAGCIIPLKKRKQENKKIKSVCAKPS